MKKLKELLNKLLSIIIVPIGALLGAFGGSEGCNKSLRRVLIPLSIMGLAFLETESILVLTIGSMIGALSAGYGIPSYSDDVEETSYDKGSAIGRFWYNLFHQNHLLADIFTRGTCGLFISLSLISVPVIKHNWLVYFIGLVSIILVQSLISWRNFGSVVLFRKKLCVVDLITWGLIVLFATLIIKL